MAAAHRFPARRKRQYLESWLLDTRKYIPVSTYDDVAYSAARLLKSGVTTTMHNHILKDPAAYETEFEEALKAYRDAGIRVQFNPGVRNANPFVYGTIRILQTLPERLRLALTAPPPAGSFTAENFIKAVTDLHSRSQQPHERVGFGPLAPQCARMPCSWILGKRRKLQSPIHVHAVQSVFQKIYGLRFLAKH